MNDWLFDEILDGLTKLASLRLDYAPSDDVLEITAATWCESLRHNREWRLQRDMLRIRAAFATLGSTRESFPKPKHLIEALPQDAMALTGPKEAPWDPPELREAMRKCGTRLDPQKASRLVHRYVASTEIPPPPQRGDHARAERLAALERELQQHYHPQTEPGRDDEG